MEKTFRGHTITVTEKFQFRVDGPEYSDDARKIHEKLFASLAAAEADIGARVEQAAVEDLKDMKLNLVVYREDGTAATITKINRVKGTLTGMDCTYVYPAVPWIRDALPRILQLQQELHTLHSRLADVRISVDRSYYGRMDASRAQREYASVEKEHAEKTAKALELAKPKLSEVS